MGIREKTLFIVGVTFLILMVSLAVTSHFVVVGGFATLEEEEVRVGVRRFESELSNVFKELERTAGDWACWDDTHLFAADRNDDYIKANLTKASLETLNINIMAFTNRSGEMFHAALLDASGNFYQETDPGSKAGAEGKTLGKIAGRILSTKKLIDLDMTRDRAHGFLMIAGTPVFMSSRAIQKNDFSGPVNGAMVIGRFLDAAQVMHLAGTLHLALDLLPVGDKAVPDDAAAVLSGQGDKSPVPIIPLNEKQITAYTLLKEISGKPAFVGRITVPRKVYGQGLKTERYYLLSMLLIGAVFTVLLVLLLNRTIISRLRLLSSEVGEIGRTGNISGIRFAPSRDELGSLADNIGNMLEQLRKARRQLMETYYHSGMAEMASGTLHNIRNSISPVLVQTVLLRDNILKLPFDHFETAVEELKDETLPEGRRKDLNRLMIEGNRSLLSIMRKNAEELNVVIERINHIEEILQDNQEYADFKRPEEKIPVEGLVKGAAKHFIKDHGDRLSIQVDPGLSDLPPVTGHQLLLRQVLDNVLINAAQAIHRKGADDGQVVIRAYADELNGGEAVHMEIADNGAGISSEAFENIFRRRFSTKGEKASGLGLHWCSNTISAMNGRIFAESEGMEKGALFHILMPAGG